MKKKVNKNNKFSTKKSEKTKKEKDIRSVLYLPELSNKIASYLPELPIYHDLISKTYNPIPKQEPIRTSKINKNIKDYSESYKNFYFEYLFEPKVLKHILNFYKDKEYINIGVNIIKTYKFRYEGGIGIPVGAKFEICITFTGLKWYVPVDEDLLKKQPREDYSEHYLDEIMKYKDISINNLYDTKRYNIFDLFIAILKSLLNLLPQIKQIIIVTTMKDVSDDDIKTLNDIVDDIIIRVKSLKTWGKRKYDIHMIFNKLDYDDFYL